jgi:hypothetical protein
MGDCRTTSTVTASLSKLRCGTLLHTHTAHWVMLSLPISVFLTKDVYGSSRFSLWAELQDHRSAQHTDTFAPTAPSSTPARTRAQLPHPSPRLVNTSKVGLKGSDGGGWQ